MNSLQSGLLCSNQSFKAPPTKPQPIIPTLIIFIKFNYSISFDKSHFQVSQYLPKENRTEVLLYSVCQNQGNPIPFILCKALFLEVSSGISCTIEHLPISTEPYCHIFFFVLLMQFRRMPIIQSTSYQDQKVYMPQIMN